MEKHGRDYNLIFMALVCVGEEEEAVNVLLLLQTEQPEATDTG